MYVNTEKVLENAYIEIIEDELNIKSVEFTDKTDSFISYKFKPQLKTVGPKYGKQLGEIRNALAELDGNSAKSELDKNGSITLSLSGGTYRSFSVGLRLSLTLRSHSASSRL